jgi:outer membrane protein with glycine zipper
MGCKKDNLQKLLAEKPSIWPGRGPARLVKYTCPNRKVTGLMSKAFAKIALIAAATVLLAACSGQPLSTREKGTIFGGVLGAGSGAIIGSAVGAPGAGAAIGGALGAGTGYVVGNAMQNNEIATKHTQSQLSSQERELQSQRSEIQRLKSESETE